MPGGDTAVKQNSHSAIIQKLRRGERVWLAEFGLRALGLGMLALCALLARTLYRMSRSPPHSASPLEFILAGIGVVCLWVGLALLFEGPGLFRLQPRPPRALY